MTPEQEYQQLYERLHNLCQDNGWGDPFSYARAREIYMAAVLGHKVADTYSGADAYDAYDELEYKSTITENINATYNGISVQDSWEEQEKYIVEDKIGKYQNHYYARFKEGKVEEVWKLNCNDVLKLLLPKIKKQFDEGTSHKKDPRIGVSIGQKEIENYGQRIR